MGLGVVFGGAGFRMQGRVFRFFRFPLLRFRRSRALRFSLLPILLLFFARHSREGGNPGPFVRERLKSLDSRFRGNDDLEG